MNFNIKQRRSFMKSSAMAAVLLKAVLCLSLLPTDAHASKSNRSYKEPNMEQLSKGGATYDVSIFSDYLFMRAYNADVVFANQKKMEYVSGGFTNRLMRDNMIVPDKNWQSGFRVGVNWETHFGAWELQTDWTYYYNKSLNNRTMPNVWVNSTNFNTEEGFYPYWAVAVQDNGNMVGAYYQDLQGVWQLNYNMINVVAQKQLRPSRSFLIIPQFGLQSGWIRQKVNAQYSRSFQNATTRAILADAHNNFWGVGVRTGILGSWSLGGGVSIRTGLMGMLLRGRTTIRTVQSVDFQGGGEFLRRYNQSDRRSHFAPGAQYLFGVSWEQNISSTSSFCFSVDWESNCWWQQFMFIRPYQQFREDSQFGRSLNWFYPFDGRGLFLEGLNLSVKFSF